MEFFKKHYDEVEFEGDEVKVLCPFHDDTRPSASINPHKNTFYCYVCGWGGSEEQFIAKLNNIPVAEASKLLVHMQTHRNDWHLTNKMDLWADGEVLGAARALGLSDDTIELLDLGLVINGGRKYLGVPIFYNKILMDVRSYNILRHQNSPKWKSEEGSSNGNIFPFDLWDRTTTTYLLEGEKDVMMARELGLNAITLTGGANSVPNDMTLESFQGMEVVVCYDNDEAGRKGMQNIAKTLKRYAKSVKYIDIAEFVKEEKEDFYDYIQKYKGDVLTFLSYEPKHFEFTEEDDRKFTTIKEALTKNILKRRISCLVTVTSEFAKPYMIPSVIKVTKTEETNAKNETMMKGEVRSWFMENTKLAKILDIIEVDAKAANNRARYLALVNVPVKEPAVQIDLLNDIAVYKAVVIDKEFDGSSSAMDIYSLKKLDVGKEYILDMALFNHPTKNQEIIGVCYDVVSVNSDENYSPRPSLLSQFNTGGTIEQRLEYLYQSAKHHVAKHLNKDLWLMADMVFNSVLEFDYGERIRGALDVFILGDTQVGKSETTSRLTSLYNFGHFLSLKTSTTVGLIGGSNKVDGAWCNTIGAIPRQHKRLVVMEEFSGAKPDFIKTMTDIRTSGILRLTRASGELTVPCRLRMIAISNPINDDNGNPRFLSTFPNGVAPIMELIKSAEDVSRYDGFLLCPKIEHRVNPFELTLTGHQIPKEAYEEKSRWVVTRQPEHVEFAEGVKSYIWEQAEILNEIFECNFPLFGVTTNQKLARFSVALAALVMNTDSDFNKVIVTKEIVDYLVKFMKKIYTMPAFRLDAYKQEYDAYNVYSQDDLDEVNKLYPNNSVMFDFLYKSSRTSRNNLATVSGLEGDKFKPIFNQLVSLKLVRIDMETVYPTEKFRKLYPEITKITTNSRGTLIDSVTK